MGSAMSFDDIRKSADSEWAEFIRPDRRRVLVGAATCGRAAGALEVLAAFGEEIGKRPELKGVTPTEVGCLGLCYAEVLVEMTGADGRRVLYQAVEPETVPELVESHLVKGEPVVKYALAMMEGPELEGVPRFEDLAVTKGQVRVVLRNSGVIDPSRTAHYIGRGGYSGLARALAMGPDKVIDEVTASGVRGRGGAGFPTGRKWSFARKASGDEKYVICNADEGDPGAFMDRAVLESDPHAVLEGLMTAGYAIGAGTGYVYVRAEYPLAIERLEKAIAQARDAGLLGKNILGSGFDFDVEIRKGAGAFVCGEETALMASIEGRRGMPRARPPFPATSGLLGKPTNINNVETLAAVSAIMDRGADWYSQFGTEKSRGTKTFALAGKIERTGLIEVPLGISLQTIIFEIGGGIPDGKRLKAVQTGGPSGGCIPAEQLDLPVDFEHLAEAGSIMGSGGMIVMDEDSCMVDVARYFVSFTEDESCGKCVPCRMGTQHLVRILTDMAEGRGRPEMIEKLKLISDTMEKGSLCALGRTAPNPVLSTLRYFPEEYEAHVTEKRCPAVVCSGMYDAPCRHACPAGMDIPAYIALVRAGRLDDAYRILKRTNPFPSICGRVCGNVCQTKCRRADLDEPVAIRHLKRFITDNAKKPAVEAVPVTRKEKVAVVGAGPAGLTAALGLKQRGYAVVVFDAAAEAGGMLRWGIPEYRLPREILRAEIADVLATGVELKTGFALGRDVGFEELDGDYDAIYVAVGAQKSILPGLPGMDAESVLGAVEFLGEFHRGGEVRVGRRVAVIGGGDSAIDAARVSLRLGAEEVAILYRRERKDMPALVPEIEAAEEEGVRIETLVAPVGVVAVDGKARGLELQRMELGSVDASGRRRPVPVEGSEFTVDLDTVIFAIGQRVDSESFAETCGVALGRNGIVEVDRQGRTSNPKVWAGGDAVTGPFTAIHAIRAGRDAAAAIDAAIRERNGEGPWSPPDADAIDVPVEVDEEPEERPQGEMPEADVRERVGDFREIELGYAVACATEEACRCPRCDYKGDTPGGDGPGGTGGVL